MKRASATTTSGSASTRPHHRGSTLTPTSTSTHPQKSKSTEGLGGKTSTNSASQKSKSQEEEREADFMSSLLADLDDDFWTAAPSSSPQRSPVKAKANVKSRSPLRAQSTKPDLGVVSHPTSAFTSATTSTSTSTSTSTFARASASAHSNKFSSSSIPSSTVFRKPITPVKSTKPKFGHVNVPLAPSSSAYMINPFASTTNTNTNPSSSTSKTPLFKSTTTAADFDINDFLQGCEDWDLGDGALSPVKPKPVVVSEPVSKPLQPVAGSKSCVAHAVSVPHLRAGSAADVVMKTRVMQRETERRNEMGIARKEGGHAYTYTPDPCTRCVVLAVEDVCVDGASGSGSGSGSGGGRKRWEKHIRALARVAHSDDVKAGSRVPEKEKEKEQKEVEVEVVLCDGWYETDVRVDDVFNVIGHFSPPLTSTTSTTTPTISLTFTSPSTNTTPHYNNNNGNLLILHPDILLTATALSSAAQCARKPVLNGLVRQSAAGVIGGEEKASPAMVYGNMLHEVLDRCLVADRWGGSGRKDLHHEDENDDDNEEDEDEDEKWMNSCIDDAIRGSLGELVRLGLEEEEVRREIRERARGFGVFARRYLGGVPKEDGILNNTRTLTHDAPSRLAITHLLDIEEDIWSPVYGIKGKIDAVVRGVIDDPDPEAGAGQSQSRRQGQGQLYNSGLARYTGKNNNTTQPQSRTQMMTRTRNQRHTPLPLELKTGRVQTGMDHRAQTMLYTLLLSERYNVDVRDGLLFYSRLRESDGAGDGKEKLVGEDIVRVPRGWNEIRGLIGLRNGLAAYMWRRIRKNKANGDDVIALAGGDDVQNRKEDGQIETPTEEREIEEDFLPPPIDDERTCKWCYSIDTCLLFRKTHPPALSNKPTVPAIPPPGRLRQLFDAHTAHLTPARVDFFRKWEKLLALEERDMVRFKRELWVLGAGEREKRGRCLGGMRVVGRGGGAGAEGEAEGDDASASVDDVEEDGDEGKWGKEGKIYRFVYTFEKDLDFLYDGADDADADFDFDDEKNNVTLQHTHLVKGDPITVSLMSPRQVLALARGYIVDFQLVPSSSSSYSSSLSSTTFSDSDSESDMDLDDDVGMDMDMDMDTDYGLIPASDLDLEDLKPTRSANVKAKSKGTPRRKKPKLIGRVVVGVDHSLQSWLDGGVGGGTPLGRRGFNLGQRRFTSMPMISQNEREWFGASAPPRYDYFKTESPNPCNRDRRDPRRAIFRIDKDELFGGMSRVRENLASLFYASGPVVVLPLPSVPSGQGQGQVQHTTTTTTTTTKMGRGNKKLLELVVDLREPVFDDEEPEEVGVEDVDADGDGDVEISSAEARYLKAVRDREQELNSSESVSTRENKEDQDQDQQHRKHELKQETQHQQQELNSAQRRAIERALSAKDYALILGMPGTGKTCVIAALVRELVFGSSSGSSSSFTSSFASSPSELSMKPMAKPKRKPKTVLISSYTHSAVDSILRKLIEGGGWDAEGEDGRIVRLGNVEKIHPEVRKFSPTFSSSTTTNKKDMTAEELENIYMNASVVATTCLGLDHPLFSRRRFDYCILDEASQITLPTCLGPLRFADVFVLVGDHHQLPPLVKNPLARLPLPTDSPITASTLLANPSLTTSLFLLLSTAHPNAVVELTEQYRMEEDIMTISNELVYGGRMRCGFGGGRGLIGGGGDGDGGGFLKGVHRAAASAAALAEEGEKEEGVMMYKQCKGEEGGDECWLERVCDDRTKAIFINTDALGASARESRVGDLVQNLGEAALVAQFVETLRRMGIDGGRVGVVTLYRQQVKVLEGLLNGSGVDKKEKGDVEIMTADKSQGRDKDCVVVSLVRSNDTGRIGDLVKDWRRINVSFTRAKFKLVIFGSRQTLEREPMLGRFFELMDRKGWVLDLLEGTERAHEDAWGRTGGGGGGKGLPHGLGTGKKRRCGWEDDDEDGDEKGKTMPRSGRNKENDRVMSSSSSDLVQLMDVLDDVGSQKDEGLEKDKTTEDKAKVKAARPTKRVRLEDKPDALLKGRPILRDLVENEMCL